MIASQNVAVVIGPSSPRAKNTCHAWACGMGGVVWGNRSVTMDESPFFGTLEVGPVRCEGCMPWGAARDDSGVCAVRIVSAGAGDGGVPAGAAG